MAILESATVYGVDGCIEKEYVAQQKEFILRENYEKDECFDISGFQYCTEKVIGDFIKECVKMTSQVLVL